MTNALTYEDALVASTRGPSLATHVALLRARQLVGGQTFSLFGAVDAVECFSLDAHGASNGVRLVGHMHGKAWPFLALRPSCREFCRELVLHFETPMLFLGPASDNATILVHAGFDELIGSFDAVLICQALARAFDAPAIWFSMSAQSLDEEAVAARFDRTRVGSHDVARVRARVHAARSQEGVAT